MSEEALRRFMDRLNSDTGFRDSVQQDPAGALAEFGLSPAERVALASNDEDALRRLAGYDLQGYMQNVVGLGRLMPDRSGDTWQRTACRSDTCDVCASPRAL
jgi:hypothetical protein